MSKKDESTSTSPTPQGGSAKQPNDYLWVKVYQVESDRHHIQYVLNALMKSLQDKDGPLQPEHVYILPRDGERTSSIAVDIHVLRTGKKPPVDMSGDAWKAGLKHSRQIMGIVSDE